MILIHVNDRFIFQDERVYLQLRQDRFNVSEGDFGENPYVLIEADILTNTLRTPVLLSAFIVSSPTAMSTSNRIIIVMIGVIAAEIFRLL